jgi:hypothetical protein
MIHVNLGSVINEIDAGKSWVSMSPGQLSSPGGASSLGWFNALSSDPAAALRALRQEGNAAAGRGGRTLRRFSQRGDGALHKPGSMD